MAIKFQYCTDIEGHFDYLQLQIQKSPIVTLGEDGEIYFKNEKSDEMFVFGGDVCDRGSDIRVVTALIRFKRRYPDRVFLILGNRDANKTRFSTELPLDPNHKFDTHEIVKPPFAKISYSEYLMKLKILEDTPVNRLKWILSHSMGAPDAFEFRREELAILTQKDKTQISDFDVYSSFRNSVEEGGFMREYLKLTQLAVKIGDTLIVHGSVTSANILKFPIGYHGEMGECQSIDEWVSRLNEWLNGAIECWLTGKYIGDYQYSENTPASALQHIAAGFNSIYKGKSVVVGNMFNPNSQMPTHISLEVAKILTNQNVHRIIVGHQPHGDTPVYIVGTETGIIADQDNQHNNIELITGDTLFSHEKAYDDEQGQKIRSTNPRGKGFAIIVIEYDSEKKISQANINGMDGYGNAYLQKLQNRWPGCTYDFDRFIGRIIISTKQAQHINESECHGWRYIFT